MENFVLIPVSNKQMQEEVVELANVIWHDHYVSILNKAQIDYMVDTFQSMTAIEKQIQKDDYEYYLMRLDNNSIGYFALQKQLDDNKIFLSKLYMKKEYRGNGYGKLTLQYIEQLCNEFKVNVLWLTVNRYNESSIRVYEKFGFIKAYDQVTSIGNGYVMDDYVMEKEI